VRLTRIDNLDLNLFDSDYDLTFSVFFLDADGKVYGRYGGRDASSPDSRQSLAGLHSAMESVLAMHERQEKEYAPRQEGSRFVRDLPPVRTRGCMHCHNVKEAVNADLHRSGKWERDSVYRFPLPENVGLTLDIDHSHVVKAVRDGSPAAALGLRPGDEVRRVNGVPVHSFADVQFGLDRAPKQGKIDVAWQRGNKALQGELTLPEGWKKGDISWRPSLINMVPDPRLYGLELTADEKKALGLDPKLLAFRQRTSVPKQAADAGVKAGDVVLGFDGQRLPMDVDGFQRHVRRNWLVGDRVTVDVLRDGERLALTMTLR